MNKRSRGSSSRTQAEFPPAELIGLTDRQPSNSLPLDEAAFIQIRPGIKGRYGLCPVAALLPNPHAVRVHSKRQLNKIARALELNGMLAPVIIDETYTILAGHARLESSKQLSSIAIPVIQIFGLSEARKRAYLVADNRIGLDAGWDREKLAHELPELTALFENEGLTLEDTGFEIAEWDQLRSDLVASNSEDLVDLSALDRKARCRRGDLFILNDRHKLLVGDAQNASDFDRLMDGALADCGFLDAPYNIESRLIGGRGKSRHPDFIMGSGEMSPSEFTEFLSVTHRHVAAHSRDGAIVYSCMDWRQIDRLLAAGRSIFGALLNLVVWAKTNVGQGTFYRSQHELISVWRVGQEAHLNNVQLGRFGRSRSNVWRYNGANTFRRGRLEDLAAHATVKNLDMVADALKDCSRPGDIVLDCFAGSGTTLLAAEKVGRRARLMELDPKYADVTLERWQAFTGRDAIHEETGLTYSELCKLRESSGAGAALRTPTRKASS